MKDRKIERRNRPADIVVNTALGLDYKTFYGRN